MATWTNLSFSVGQILQAAQMNQLQENFTAVAQGASGAPGLYVSAISSLNPTVDDLNKVVLHRGILRHTTTTSGVVGAGTPTVLSFTAEDYNTSGFGSSSSQFTVNSGSPYVVLYGMVQTYYIPNSIGYWVLEVYRNGAQETILPKEVVSQGNAYDSGITSKIVTFCSAPISTNSGDYFQLRASHSWGSALHVRDRYFGIKIVGD